MDTTRQRMETERVEIARMETEDSVIRIRSMGGYVGHTVEDGDRC
jgi:hypothetical protein